MRKISADDCDNVKRLNKISTSTPDKMRLLDPCFSRSILSRKAPCLGGCSLEIKIIGLNMPAFAGLSDNRLSFGVYSAEVGGG